LITLKLTLGPVDHSAVTDAAKSTQCTFNRNQVPLIRSKKVGHFSVIDLVSAAIVNLRCAFEDAAPNPHDTLYGLLGPHGRADELVVAHHAGIVAEPAAHFAASILAACTLAPCRTDVWFFWRKRATAFAA
jgi:hypothetical protein